MLTPVAVGWGLVWCEELCRSSRLLSAKAVVDAEDTYDENKKNRQEFPLSLYQPYCSLLCFLLREINKNKADSQDDLLRNKVSLWALIERFELLNLIHILLNISSKSFENHAKYLYEKFRRVCKRKADTRH